MFSDFLISLQWWFVLFLLGILFFPLTSFLFPRFIDKGYAFSKTTGILLLSYVVLVTGTLHILPFSFVSLLILLLIFGVTFYLCSKRFHLPLFSFKDLLKTQWQFILIEELLFLAVFLFWSYIRSFAPDINGLEKFMDYGFVNSILRSDYFPAKDMWFTPFSINYYYFGHFVTAVLTKLSLLSSNYTYNLMIATLSGLTFISSFSIAINLYSQLAQKKYLIKLIVVGILSSLLVTFASNLHTIYTFFKPYQNDNPVPPWELVFSPQTFPNEYWYPNATRFIHNTIHEFPIYSWVVSDLHGHVTDIPFVLLTIAYIFSLLLLFYTNPQKKKTKHSSLKILSLYYRLRNELPLPPIYFLFLSLFVAVMYMTNAWDGLIYLLLGGLFLVFLEWQRLKKFTGSFVTKVAALVLELVMPVLILGGGFFLFSLPFSVFFKPFVSGIGVLCAPELLTNIGSLGPLLFEPDHCQRSPWWQLLILYGFFYVFVLLLLLTLSRTKKWLLSDVFVVMLTFLSTFLILVPEFIYAKDIYPAHYRANTMFKLVFQAFIMLSLVSGYAIARITAILKSQKTVVSWISYAVFFVISLLLLTLVFIYPYYAIMSYYGELKNHKGLNGTAYLNERYPDDAKAMDWLMKNTKDQPVVLEAQGDSYTDYARVSANTGLPTVLGWTVHEWLWRGSYDIPAPRINEIKEMYELNDINRTRSLLKKYNVRYVFLGQLEREKYSVNEEKFEELGKKVFQSGETIIFEIR